MKTSEFLFRLGMLCVGYVVVQDMVRNMAAPKHEEAAPPAAVQNASTPIKQESAPRADSPAPQRYSYEELKRSGRVVSPGSPGVALAAPKGKV